MNMKKKSSDFTLITSFLAGAAALIYELVCQRYLSLVLGSEAYVVAVTVGFYMIGLSAGSIIFGIFSDRNRKLALYLSILGFAVFCGFSPLIYMLVSKFARFGSLGGRVAGSLIFVLPATICAGGVIPCLIKYGGNNKKPAHIYAAYTLGSVIGALVCGYMLIRFIGITATAIFAAVLSLLCGLLIYLKRNRSRVGPKPRKTKAEAVAAPIAYPKRIVIAVIAAYCASGFASMVFQVFQTKILTLFFRDSVYDFTVILTVFLIGLFAGNYFGGRVAAKEKHLLSSFALLQALAGVAVMVGLYIVNLMPAITYDISSPTIMIERFGGNAFLMSNVIKAGYTALVVLIPAFFWGTGFPLVNKITFSGAKNTGKITGLTIGINTLLCAAGSLLSAFWLVNVLGIKGLVLLSGVICVVTGIAAGATGFGKYGGYSLKQKLVLPCLAVITAALWIFLPQWDRFEMSTSFLKPGQNVEGAYDILYYNEDAYGLTSVVDFYPTNQKFLTTNRRFCQNSSDLYGPEDHRRLGIIPLIIHPAPKNVLAVGLGAGITLGGANAFPGVNIDCVEISASVVEAAGYFGEENGHVLDADNVNIIIDDGRNYIKNTKKSYDVIIADIFFPMSIGSSSLFSREYYQMCKDRLNPKGIMAQWIPAHQFSTNELDITMKTFASVFENCQLWFGLLGTSVPVIGIIGSQEAIVIDGNRLTRLYEDEALSEVLAQIALDDKYMLLSHFIADLRDTPLEAADVPLNTDDRPILEYLNPEDSTPYYIKGEDNIFYAYTIKLSDGQTEYCVNIDEVTLEYYNTAITEYIFNLYNDYNDES